MSARVTIGMTDKPWTIEDILDMYTYRKMHYPRWAIAEYLGRTDGAVRSKLYRITSGQDKTLERMFKETM